MVDLKKEIELAGVDYQPPKIETVSELDETMGHFRLNGLSQVEELIQLILVNKELSGAIYCNVNEVLEKLSNIAKQLREF